MKVLMFGWEFPPLNSGGLGTACFGLTKSLSDRNVKITFVLPYDPVEEPDFMRLISPNIRFERISTLLTPYMTSSDYNVMVRDRKHGSPMYGESLFEEVTRYAEVASRLALIDHFDIIHCHDWMTFQAGIAAKRVIQKPLVVHVHSTEFDRTGGNGVNQQVYDIEREGMHAADRIIAVSHYTKNQIIRHYGVAPEKIVVAHNAVTPQQKKSFLINKQDKVILFLGRITLQKGPDYFVYAAKRVLEVDPHVKFLVAGSGDMEHYIIEKSAELGMSRNMMFAGFLKGDDILKAYQMADLYVMPSVSEPFGITALESMQQGTPVLISKQSGVSEVVTNCLKADFWDTDDLANKMLSVLKYKVLHHALKDHGSMEIQSFHWDKPALKVIDVYNSLM